MTERERLIELLNDWGNKENDGIRAESIADYLLAKGIVVPRCKTVWYIVDRNTEFECVMSKSIEDLPLYIVKNLGKYGYYECKEEAEAALKDKARENGEKHYCHCRQVLDWG